VTILFSRPRFSRPVAGPRRILAQASVLLLVFVSAGCRLWSTAPPRTIAAARDELPNSPDALLAIAAARDTEDSPREDLLVAVEAYTKALRLVAAESSRQISLGELSWRLARACFLLAEIERNTTDKLATLARGGDAATRSIRERPDRVEGHYWRAVLVGRQAENSGLGFSAMKLAKEVEKLGLAAAQIDPRFENGGPLRLLAMLYAKAPPWPTSIGDIDKALEYADRAVTLVDYPLNRLFRAEVLIEAEDFGQARTELKAVLTAPKVGQWAREGERWRPYARQLLGRISDR
jgi:tetratricopeptide (TPR) repeat protein